MLKPYQMSSVIIAGPNNVQEEVIKELYALKILHIIEHSKNELADIGKPLQSAAKLSEILVKVRALISALGIKKDDKDIQIKENLLNIESTTRKLNEELGKSLDELKKIDVGITKNEALKQEIEALKDIKVPLEAFAPYKSLDYFVGYLKNKDSIITLKAELSKTTQKFMLLHSTAKGKPVISLFIDSKSKESAGSALQKLGFFPITLANMNNLKGIPSSNLKKTEEMLADFKKKKDEIQKRVEGLKQEYKGFLIAAEEFLSEQLEKAEAPLKFASTQSSFLVKGWIPSNELSNSIERLNKISKNRILLHFEPAKKNDNVPVKLKNPKFAEPFEFFMDLYALPTYKEIDPTFFVFLTFPILFGFMLGDIGYGLVTFVLAVIMKKVMPKAKNFFNIMIFASLATMLFGFLFGEFFGFEGIAGFELPHMISRAHDINQLMYLAILVGVVHINLGLLIGFFNELKSHDFMTALFAKGAWFVLETGIVLIALSTLKIFTSPTYVGIIVILLSAIMLFKGEGIRGPIEIPSIFSNTLSYARLMAIGLSSVVLAVIINQSAQQFFQKGGFLILIGVLILVVGHAINIMLGLLGSFLHALRLHYVEFFTKFFHGGAKRYQPFGARS